MRMRSIGLTLALVAALTTTILTGVGCGGPPPSIVTDPGKAAYKADQVVTRIGEFQNAVIDASDANKIRVADARVIVGWTTTALQALKETPNGWQAIALAGWPKARALANASPQLAPFVPIVDGLLGYQGGQ